MNKLSPYAISHLINAIFQVQKIKRAQFVDRLGYYNINKGLRSLDSWLETGWGTFYLIERLILTYPHLVKKIDQAMEQTVDVREIEYRAHQRAKFKPYMQVETELTIPSQIAFYALTGMHKNKIIEFVNAELEDEDFVKNFIAAHFQRLSGFIPFMGKIKNYTVVFSPAVAYSYSIVGVRGLRILSPVGCSICGIEVKRKSLEQIFEV